MRPQEDIERLIAAAESWSGTPFCANSATKGRGVSCHQLVAEIYFESGWLPRIPFPAGSPRWAQGSDRSLIERWMDREGLAWFAPAVAPIQPGDLMGFRIGHCVHHLAIALDQGRITHAVQGHGAGILDGIPTVWMPRLTRIWTPTPGRP